MNTKSIALLITGLAALNISYSVTADDGLSANIGVTSNYLWRGISQTSNNPAISAGIDYEKSSFSIGTWLSNADWAEEMSYELDLYAAYSSDINEHLSYSVGYIYYAYDNDADSNFSELNAALTFQGYTFAYHTLVNSDAGASFTDDYYLAASTSMPIMSGFELALHIGRYHFKTAENYLDYSVSVLKNGFSFTISDTDLAGPDGDVNFVLSYSHQFNF